MKKITAILAVLVMILPMCFVAQAEDASTETKPFYLLNWSAIPEEVKEDNVFGLYYLWTSVPGANATELSIAKDFADTAAKMKASFDARPAGTRYLMIATNGRLSAGVEYRVFLDKGVKMYKEYLEKMLGEFKRLGGQLDGMAIDFEYSGYSASDFDKAYQDDPMIYKSIVEDPRYQERIRPELEKRGFKFWPTTNDYQPEIYSINEKTGAEYAQNRNIWDGVLRDLMIWYMNEAFSPLYKYYPDASLSNYRYYASKSWLKTLNRNGGGTVGNSTYLGNTTTENAYFYKPADSYFKNTNTNMPTFKYPISYNKAFLEGSKFSTFMWDMATFKNMMQVSDAEHMAPWVTRHDYAIREFSASDSAYYTETYLHIGMMNPVHFLGYITKVENGDYPTSIQIMADILHELTRVAGAADRKYINLPHDWNRSFALTGMYAGGRNIWRITPDVTGSMTLEKFKVEGTKDPTFYINGQTVTFPGGKIIETGEITLRGSCGYWVETPADVLPIVTSDADRYEMFPAFGENFDGYETGMEYIYNNVEHVSSWQIKKKKDATAVIQEDKNSASNKVLAVTGTYTMKNVRVIENVTAGDTYAEDQSWKTTVTIPANMAADAEAIILSIYGDKSKYLDGGFKVAGGKLYYYNGEDHVELEGVDVSAGGKFTFKRVMDFNKAEAFTCDYVVYDAAGKELAKVKDVPVGKDVKAPVEGIGFEFSKIAGSPILLDDYKLYASGVATDFELYDAAFGQKLEDLDKARDKATAYRLSWMNATAYEKVYSIVAAYYNGDKLVEEKVLKEIKMSPNTDAVETGVVEVAEGQSVRLYVRNDSKPEPSDDDNNVAKDPADLTGNNLDMLLFIIAGALALIAVVIVVIVVVSIKKKAPTIVEKKADDAENSATE